MFDVLAFVIFIVEIDEGIVMQLMSMGFNIEGCKRAVFHTNNQGVFAAIDKRL